MQKGKRDLDTKKRVKRRQQRVILKSLLSLLIVGAVGGSLYVVPRLSRLTITTVAVVGNDVVPTLRIEKKVNEELTGLYAYLFPKRADFLYPKQEIQKSILALDPHILSASVILSNLTEVTVSVVERKPYALFCGDTESTSTKPCYFLDDTGFLYSEAPEFSDALFVTYYGTTTAALLGTQFLPPAEFKAVDYTRKQLEKMDHKVDTISLKEGGVIEMKLVTGGKLVFALSGDYGKALSNLKALIASSDFKAKDGAGILQVDYIDLRFGNKVFYKPLH